MKIIFDLQEWKDVVAKLGLWVSETSPYKAYNSKNTTQLLGEWDKYKETGWIKNK